MAGPPNSSVCSLNLATALRVCSELCLPLHPGKCEGPSTILTVLGIQIDTVNRIAKLPEENLADIRGLLEQWSSLKWCTRHELESLIGHLHHAAKAVWPGRTFIRRMIDQLRCFRHRQHLIRIGSKLRLDLQWWRDFIASWNGVSFWLYPGMAATPTTVVTSDAAGVMGYGAFHRSRWFNGVWTGPQKFESIAYKELFPIVVAAHVWGHSWRKQHVLFRTDNEAVVCILTSRTSRIPSIMHLLRSLLLVAARQGFSFSAAHVPGVENSVADALSRFNWQAFVTLAPWAAPSPTSIPQAVLVELTQPTSKPDAGSCYYKA
ncbi:uncharacterized protein LOC116603398 [Nematostella vectensis]|uniref:uncharacterized protein LOC116603398 n=1 Tax=Nematostella vectensis TaxID=45351 RepID=UPI00138FDEB6|nr:uncharacterized protein LOC116603398 [Nematostella vectensis]